MKATVKIQQELYTIDLSKPLDISLALRNDKSNPNAWYLDAPMIEPVQIDNYIAKVSEGASINFNTITFNPHAHGTHTECVGHIAEKVYSVNEQLQRYFFTAEVISVAPERLGEDYIIPVTEIRSLLKGKHPEAVVIRTLPNTSDKRSKQYSHTNWPYLEEAAAQYLADLGVLHLLIDLPSVDKEKDEGALLAHKAFWQFPKATRMQATITEFIYVDNYIQDGSYLLNLQVAPFENDAAPSRPVLYKFE